MKLPTRLEQHKFSIVIALFTVAVMGLFLLLGVLVLDKWYKWVFVFCVLWLSYIAAAVIQVKMLRDRK